MFSISGIVHLRSKAFDRTILKIYANVFVNLSRLKRVCVGKAYLLYIDTMACAAED